ncbi:MAG: hypothetical protein A3I61_16700 [Acidobacteria bacterium RIFCSPLOWO2_02_FULL_68_18]|nr:MAG: hypothetical protein A3I61_16700 [Acidobacteria bacterium RIFCSPLOWO2_02_FULL_68_18]OFW50098.1 MAG: hypothetical protein A3G77_09080 [Acidobacteria bacterium RIFCSPLOWO2_12_FULL_68_19]
MLRADPSPLDGGGRGNAKPRMTGPAKISLSPGAELWEDFCVPSDYLEFNTQVHLPVATGEKTK